MKKLFWEGIFFFFLGGFLWGSVLFAATIQPGLTLTKDNYNNYLTSLEEFTDPALYGVLVDALEKGEVTIPIVGAKKYDPSNVFSDATKKYHQKCSLTPDGVLKGWRAGVPFPEPKNALELAWNFEKRQMIGDDYYMKASLHLMNKNAKIERTFAWHYWKYAYAGRCFFPPIPEEPGNKDKVHFKEEMVVFKPFDVKGFCMIRTRYLPLERDDEVYNYIPAIRRVRRMSGADVCDPVLGSDLIFDDFDYMRQKIDPKIMEFKMGEREMLIPCLKEEPTGVPPDPFKTTVRGNLWQFEWEIAPVWTLEIKINDRNYIYSKRMVYIRKGRKTFNDAGIAANYDQAGRLFRSSIIVHSIVGAPSFAEKGWHVGRMTNHITDHCTMNPHEAEHGGGGRVVPKQFSFKWLLSKAR